MAFTINTPASEWRILKYVRGALDNWYIISEQALRNGKNNYITVNIHMWDTGHTYPHRFKADNSDIIIYEWANVPANVKELLYQQNPALFDQFRSGLPKSVSKSGPTPDDFYVCRGKYGSSLWLVLRNRFDNTKDMPSNASQYWSTKEWVGLNGRSLIAKWKFPQLSSEIKQELQKENPERYKEWEDFYCKKYPNMQRLSNGSPRCGCGACNSCLERIPLPDPKDDYITVSYGELALVRRCDYTRDKKIPLYSYNNGWILKYITSEIDTYPDNEVIKSTWKNCDGIKIIVEQFEQYYAELEQQKVAFHQGAAAVKRAQDIWEHPSWDTNLIIDSKDYIITSTTCGWGFMPLVLLEDGYNQCRLWADPKQLVSVQYRDKLTLDTMLKATCLPEKYPLEQVQKAMRKSNIVLYEMFSKVADNQSQTTKVDLSNYSYDMFGKTPYMFYIYTVGRGFEFARREAIDGMNKEPQPDDKVMLIKASDYSVRDVDHKYITQWNRLVFADLNKEQRVNFQKQNPILYGQWTHMDQYPKLQSQNIYNRPDPFIPSNIMVVSTVDHNAGWAFIDAKLWNSLGQDDKYSACVWADTNRFTKARTKGETSTAELLSEANTDRLSILKNANPELYQQAFTAQVGSDFDIDEKVMAANYKKQLIKRLESPKTDWHEQAVGHWFNHSRIDSDVIRGKQHSHIFHEEAAPFKAGMYDPQRFRLHAGTATNYLVGYDPYQADFETQGVITIWSRDSTGQVVNRLIELTYKDSWQNLYDTFKHDITPQDYHNLIMNSPSTAGIVWTKPRRVGQTAFNEEVRKHSEYFNNIPEFIKNYSPNTNQNNHEIINVPRKTINITSGQEYSRSSVSSYRRPPAVTTEHTKYGQEPCRGKEKTGSCKIS